MAQEEIESLYGEYMSSILHILRYLSILSYIYLCGSRSTKVLNTDPICIRIHDTVYEYQL